MSTIWEQLNPLDAAEEGVIPSVGALDPITAIANGLIHYSNDLSKGFKSFTRTKFRGIILHSELVDAGEFAKTRPSKFPASHLRKATGKLYKVYVHIPFYTGVLPVPTQDELSFLSGFTKDNPPKKSKDVDKVNRLMRMISAFPAVYGRSASKPRARDIATFEWYDSTQKFAGLYHGSERQATAMRALKKRTPPKP